MGAVSRDVLHRNLSLHLEITPEVAGGKSCTAGHHITVQNIVVWHERLGRTAAAITAEYNLTFEETATVVEAVRADVDRPRR